jgi:hypothetical protein
VGLAYATLSPNQWDGLLEAVYDLGWVLLELDEAENIIRAFRRGGMSS